MNARLQHVTIARPPGADTPMRAFYGGLLGLEEIEPPRALAPLNVIWYRLGSETELHILPEEPTGQDHTGRHFCLAVDDVVACAIAWKKPVSPSSAIRRFQVARASSCAIRLAT